MGRAIDRLDQASDRRAIGLILASSESKNGTAYILRSRRLHSAQLARETCDEMSPVRIVKGTFYGMCIERAYAQGQRVFLAGDRLHPITRCGTAQSWLPALSLGNARLALVPAVISL